MYSFLIFVVVPLEKAFTIISTEALWDDLTAVNTSNFKATEYKIIKSDYKIKYKMFQAVLN